MPTLGARVPKLGAALLVLTTLLGYLVFAAVPATAIESPFTLSVNDTSASESAPQLTFTVTISPTAGNATVQYVTADGSATAGSDYTPTSGTLTFTPGTPTTRTVNVPIIGDFIDEANETVFLDLRNASANVSKSRGIGTIVDNDTAPNATIDDVNVAEGTGGSVNAIFTVALSAPSGAPTTVDYATTDGTATAPGDYTTTAGTLTIPAGNMSGQIPVAVASDNIDESDEAFTVTLSNPSNAFITDGTATGNIQDDDSASVVISDATAAEGNTGTSIMTFNVTLSGPSQSPITVDYATQNGVADDTDDFVPAQGTLAFAPGETAKTIDVSIKGDTSAEPNEFFTTVLRNATNVYIADASARGTIVNDDGAPPMLSVNDPSEAEGDSGTTDLVFTITLMPPSDQQVHINYGVVDDTATSPTDYAVTNGTAIFAPGATTAQVVVPVNGDLSDEEDETLNLVLQPNQTHNADIDDGQGTGTIIDDDVEPTVSIDHVTVTEGDDGDTPAVFTVSLSEASGKPVTVDFATADGVAVDTSDYTSVSGTVAFEPGETSKTVTVQVTGDTLDEFDESFGVLLSNPFNADLGIPSSGDGTIGDDDPLVSASIDDVTIAEGGQDAVSFAKFTISLSAPSGKPVSLQVATADGTATSPEDYVGFTTTVTIDPGETTREIFVPVKGDTLDELDETYTVTLSNPVEATIADGSGLGTITNDDVPPTMDIADASATEGALGSSSNVTIPVTITPAPGRAITVNYATSNGTAAGGTDYAITSGTLSFAIGESTKDITVAIFGDNRDENDETFTVTLSSPNGAVIGDGTSTVTIIDDDAPPALSITPSVTKTEGSFGTTKPFTYTVTLSAPSNLPVSVQVATADGTATAGLDYNANSTTLNFAPGEVSKTFTVTVIGDPVREANETFLVNLTAPSNATISGSGQGTGVILNDD